MTQHLSRATVVRLLHDWRFLAAAGAGVAAVITAAVVVPLLLLRDGGESPELAEPAGFALSPEGTDVPRLLPVRVTFETAPIERDGARILAIDPPVAGQFAWASDRTLLFQPEFPGYLRGQEYEVTVAARPDAGLDTEMRVSFVAEGVLTVESVVPAPGDVEVPANAQVLVQFSRSVAALAILAAQSSAPVIAFDPPLPGTGEWLNTSLYRFTPDAVAPSTVYTATIRAGLTSEADGVLAADYTWSFTSFGPALDGVTPEDRAEFASLTQPVTVYFNQPMDRASVETGIAVTRSRDGLRVPGAFAWNDEANRVIFTPSPALDHLATYRVDIASGLAAASGATTTVGRSVSFTTVGLPVVSSSIPKQGETSAGRYGIQVTFSNPMDVESLEGRISVTGFDADEVERGTYIWDDRNLNLSLPLRPSTAYTVRIAPGATDRYGQPLGAYELSFTTGRMEPFLMFAVPGQVATYMASAEPILYFHSANYTSARFTLYPITREEARYLQVRNYIPGDPRGEDFNPSLPALRTWTESFAAPENEIQLTSTSLSGGGPLPEGDYYLLTSTGAEFAFAVVDTAIVLKQTSDELLAWVVDLATGEPVPGVTVNADGEAIDGAHDRQTDGDGIARFALRKLESPYVYRGIDQGVVSVRGSGRYGVATMNWQQGFSPWQINVPFDPYMNRSYVGHVYTDRPIYRPGETLHLKGIIRADDDAAYSIPPPGEDFRYAIIDSQGNVVDQGPVSLNAFGSFAVDFDLPASADTGNYGLQVSWQHGDRERYGDIYIAGTSFLVAEFRRPEFEVELTSGAPSYAAGSSMAIEARGEFFFGGAVQGARVDWSAISDPFMPYFEEYREYAFGDNDSYFSRYLPPSTSVIRDRIRATGTAITGDDGVAAFSVPAEIIGGEGPQLYTVSASVLDTSGQTVANSITVPVHPSDGYAGLRTTEYLAPSGQPAEVELVTVDNDGNPLPNRPVTVRVYERTWVTTKEITPEGGRRYRSEPVDTLLETLSATTGANGEGSVTIGTGTVGTLRIVAEYTGANGRSALCATYLWVYGEGAASWYVSNDDSIDLVPDREAYEVGDTAEILVPAPFAGAIGLVTVERGSIHSATVEAFPTNSSSVRIPITERSVPNIYVSTTLYRPPTDEDPVPRFKIGYAALPVSTETRTLTVDIAPDRAQAQPGETVGYDIRVTDSEGRGVEAEISVAVVDKAVLSLAEERGPDGLLAFWFERGLGIQTASTLASLIDRTNDVIQEPRQGGKGGGGVDSDQLRSEFRNTAYWAAQIVTAADGTAHVDVPLPDNLTTWRMQVRAISSDAMVGEGTNELLSTVPLLLRPALPRFLRVGDEVTLRVLARNATDAPLDVSVALDAEGVRLSDESGQSRSIAPGESVPFEWPASIDAAGTAKLTFRATSGSLDDAVLQELPVALDVTGETTATGGVVRDTAQQEAIFLPDFAILEGGTLDVAVEASLVGLLGADLKQFAPPPAPWDRDESTDAIAARIIATVAVYRAEESAGRSSGLDARIRTDLAQLLTRQASDGGWLWHPRSLKSNPWLTGWALVAIGEAGDAGFAADSVRVASARFYIQGYLNRSFDVERPPDPDDHAFLVWSLAIAGEESLAAPLARSLWETQRANLGFAGKAYLMLALQESEEPRDSDAMAGLLNDVTAGVIASANGNHWEDEDEANGHYRGRPSRSAVDTTALVILALARGEADHPLVEESVRWLVVAREPYAGGGTGGAIAIDALSTFARGTGELAGNFRYRVAAGSGTVLEGRADATTAETSSRTLPLTDFERGKVTVVEFLRDFGSPGRLYYRLNLRYKTPAAGVEALNRGMAISHRYSLLDDPSQSITSATVGDIVRVEVTVMTPAERNFVVAEDFLPAGLEPIDPNLATEDVILKRQLAEERIVAAGVDTGGWWAPWAWWYYTPFDQATIRDDRVVLDATTLPKGVHTYVYYARATVPGDYFVAPAHIEETRFPEVFGRGDSSRFTVVP